MDKIITDLAQALRNDMSASDLAAFKAMNRSDLLQLHFSLGYYVRNEYLYGNQELQMQLRSCDNPLFCEPDALSEKIVDRLWELLQDEE